MQPTQPNVTATPTAATRTRWKLLLLLPYLFLGFPILYARNSPTLFGFPFFYWYQFLWVILTSLILTLVYRKLRY
jgi:hypothetical protein